MTTALPATSRAGTETLQTHRAPRTKSFAARPEPATTASFSPAALAASAAAPEATTASAAPVTDAPKTPVQTTPAHTTPVQKAYRNPAA